MVVEVRSTPSRRAILAGLIGGLAATAATAIERAQPVAAGSGPLLLGEPNTASDATTITNSGLNADVFAGNANGTGAGLIGSSESGSGIWGHSNAGRGVFGSSDSDSVAALIGWSEGSNCGVQGFSSDDEVVAPPSSPTKTGVYGYAKQDDTACGVRGETTSGIGVSGVATGGIGVDGFSDSYIGVRGTSTSDIGVIGVSGSSFGVRGSSTSGDGVHGYSPTGNGVLAQTLGGYAIKADGRLNFSRASGVASIPAGSTSHTWEPLVDITAASFVLLTPMANIGTRALWFTKNTTSGTITIHLSSSRTSATKISWLLLG